MTAIDCGPVTGAPDYRTDAQLLLGSPGIEAHRNQETSEMLLNEELARARIQEAEDWYRQRWLSRPPPSGRVRRSPWRLRRTHRPRA